MEIVENTDLIENGKIIWKYTFTELLVEKSIPTYIQIFDLNKVIISFRDGRICILLLHFINEILQDIKPTVLFNFQSNRDYKFSVMSFHICSWTSQEPDFHSFPSSSSLSTSTSASASRGSSNLKFEIITFNSGDILSHWRLNIQTKYNNEKKEIKEDSFSNLNNTGNDDIVQKEHSLASAEISSPNNGVMNDSIMNAKTIKSDREDVKKNDLYEKGDDTISNTENNGDRKDEDNNYDYSSLSFIKNIQFMGVRRKVYKFILFL